MVRRTVGLAFLQLLFLSLSPAQQAGWSVAGSVRGMLTTSSKLFPYPDGSTPERRTLYTPLNSVLGAGLDVRVKIPEDIFFFTLTAEYISVIEKETRFDASLNPPQRVPTEEGYFVVPIEIGAHMYIPIGSETWRISMGGGFGVYYGERIYKIAGVGADSRRNRLGVGIHVATVTEYRIYPGVSVVGGLKFRDPEIDTINRFETLWTMYNGSVIPLPTQDLKSRINLDGMALSLGILIEIL